MLRAFRSVLLVLKKRLDADVRHSRVEVKGTIGGSKGQHFYLLFYVAFDAW